LAGQKCYYEGFVASHSCTLKQLWAFSYELRALVFCSKLTAQGSQLDAQCSERTSEWHNRRCQKI